MEHTFQPTMIIYKIVNKVNGDFYIGKTIKTKEERLKKHFYNANYNSQTYLHRSIRKYGNLNFIIEEIENQIPQDQLDKREIFWINELKPTYNMTAGGDGGKTHLSPNFINAMKEYHQRKPKEEYATRGMLGKKFPDEAKKKVSKANSKPISIDGVEYKSMKEAQENLNWGKRKVQYRVDSLNYPHCFRL